MPMRRKAVPVASRSSSAPRPRASGWQNRWTGQARVAGADRKVPCFQLQHHAAGGQFVFPQAADQLFVSRHRYASGSAGWVRSVLKVVSALIDLVSRDGPTERVSLTTGTGGERWPFVSQVAARLLIGERLEVAEQGDALRREFPRLDRADTRQQAHRLGCRQGGRLLHADHGEAAWLVPGCGDLVSSRLGARPMETVTPTICSTSRAKQASTTAGGALCEHRHGAAYAIHARHVAGGGDETANAASDNHRFGRQFWIIALFETGAERVAVDMGDGQIEQFGVADDACAVAGGSARCVGFGQAVAAEGALGTSWQATATRRRVRLRNHHGGCAVSASARHR